MKSCDILKWSPKRGWSIIGEVSQWRVKTFKIVSQKRVVSHWRVVTLKRGLKTDFIVPTFLWSSIFSSSGQPSFEVCNTQTLHPLLEDGCHDDEETDPQKKVCILQILLKFSGLMIWAAFCILLSKCSEMKWMKKILPYYCHMTSNIIMYIYVPIYNEYCMLFYRLQKMAVLLMKK
jgi:hypothetical protein